MSDKLASHGRGGAGNIAPASPATNPTTTNLETPTIKENLYTTGRGGSGNMAKNDPGNPSLARDAQDVNPIVRSSAGGESHIGRGGAANTARNDEELNSQGGLKGVVEKVKDVFKK